MLHRRTRVQASPAEVWDVIGDPGRWNEFFVGITRWEPVESPGPGADPTDHPGQVVVGDRYWIRMGVGSIEAGGRIRFTRVEPGRRLEWETEAGTDHTLTIRLDEDEGVTFVSIDFDLRLLGGILSRVAEQAAYRMVGRNLKASLHVLRHLVEHERAH